MRLKASPSAQQDGEELTFPAPPEYNTGTKVSYSKKRFTVHFLIHQIAMSVDDKKVLTVGAGFIDCYLTRCR